MSWTASIQELIRVALVHSSWHDMVMKNEFWRRRLSGQLPPELVFHLDRCRGSWSREARRFFNSNLLANPEFKSQGIANAAGLGRLLSFPGKLNCNPPEQYARLHSQPRSDIIQVLLSNSCSCCYQNHVFKRGKFQNILISGRSWVPIVLNRQTPRDQ